LSATIGLVLQERWKRCRRDTHKAEKSRYRASQCVLNRLDATIWRVPH